MAPLVLYFQMRVVNKRVVIIIEEKANRGAGGMGLEVP